MPGVVPAPFGATVSTYAPVLFSKEALKFVHSGAGLRPVTMYRLPVNLAGASGPIGGLYCGLPSICSCQFDSAPEVVGCLFGTIALAYSKAGDHVVSQLAVAVWHNPIKYR